MNPLERIDALVLKPYQAVVDWSQRKPTWWVEQCAIALTVSGVMRAFISPYTSWTPVFLFFDLLIFAIFFAWSRSDTLLAAAGNNLPTRLLILVLELLALPALYYKPPSRALIQFMNDFAFVSVYYFAACRPPKPREPKRKLVPSM